MTIKCLPLLALLLVLVALSSCATFTGQIPLEAVSPGEIYISPAGQDGIQDAFQLTLDIPEMKGLKAAGFKVSVLSSMEELVYEKIYGISDIPKGIRGWFKAKPSVSLPEVIIWAGQDNDGNFADDGVYQLTVTAWDYKGQTGALPPIKIIVDNTPPEALVSLPYTVFSPNADGNLDDLRFFQETSSELLWEGVIEDDKGNKVRDFTWEGDALDFSWDGMTSTGVAAPEGAYSYTLSATDPAGNSFSSYSAGLRIDRRVAAVSVVPSLSAISPNGDGIKDEVTFRVEVDIPLEIKNSKFEIIDNRGRVVRDYILEKPVFPMDIKFNGRGNTGFLLADSLYFGKIQIQFLNGNRREMVSEPVRLDRRAPEAVIAPSLRIFSPDGDGRKDLITINQSTSIEGAWTGKIRTAGGDVVREFNWMERAITFDWDGTDSSGKMSPDGEFFYTLSSTDTAGNSTSVNSRKFILNTVPTPVSVVAGSMSFSPNGDGVNDFIDFELKSEVPEGIIGWNYKILGEDGREVVSFKGNAFMPQRLMWQGANSAGEMTEGRFLGKLEVEYEKGNLSSSEVLNPFTLDLSPPQITSSVTPLPFSPDGDGENDRLQIKVTVSDVYNTFRWSADVIDPAGNIFMTIPSTRFRNGEFIWDGKSASGELVQSASDYTLTVKAVDSVGNASSRSTNIPVDILVLKEGNNLRISISSIYFKPYTADYMDVEPDLYEKNMETLEKLAVILMKYQGYRIRLEGHAVRLYWDRPERWLTEENEVLGPLSEQRAEAIRDALVSRGLRSERITIQGIGGYRPVVPHSDLINRWKNRRVEFILLK